MHEDGKPVKGKLVGYLLKVNCLRTACELACRQAHMAVTNSLVVDRLNSLPQDQDAACRFWTEGGVLDWSLNRLALTCGGVRRPRRYERNRWSTAPF